MSWNLAVTWKQVYCFSLWGGGGGEGGTVDHTKGNKYHSISVWKNRYGMFLQGDLEDAKHLNEYVIPSSVKHMPALGA